MGFFSFEKLHEVWRVWDLRAFVLLSLFLQFFLIIASPFRKKTTNAIITISIWLAYLLADWAATFAVGIMSRSQGDASVEKRASDLMTFWAPFLINHLGGPDTITAFSLEDNELWLRHLLQLIAQLAATGYVFYKSLPSNKLMVPTILMFIAGLIKYGERTQSLYRASMKKFRSSLQRKPDPGANYARLAEEYEMRFRARRPTLLDQDTRPEVEYVFWRKGQDGKVSDLEVVRDAYKLFIKFKGLVADLILTIAESRITREHFITWNAEKAFRVMEIELNFIYEVLYTKMVVIHERVGYFLRFVSFVLLSLSFWIWYSKDKSHFQRDDVNITYTLLGGAIALDVIAFFMLIFSDWTIAHIKIKGHEKESEHESPVSEQHISKRECLINRFLAIGKRRWSKYTEKDKSTFSLFISRTFCRRRLEDVDRKVIPFPVLVSRIFHRRWSESIQQFNLMDYCLNVRNQKVENLYEWLGITDILDEDKYVSHLWFSESLRDSIFLELKKKSEKLGARVPEEFRKARGEWVLEHNFSDNGFHLDLEPWISTVDYDESLIVWHIATELCYNRDMDDEVQDEEQLQDDSRENSKILSDYMLYLLLRQPKMMTTISGISQYRFKDTSAGVKKFLRSLVLDKKDKEKRLRKACRKLLDVNLEISPKQAMGGMSKSVLFDGCCLAKKLIEIGEEENKWQVIHAVWIEMLGYAATHCSGNAHADQLSKGGQLVTFVWLLMAHLGLASVSLSERADLM